MHPYLLRSYIDLACLESFLGQSSVIVFRMLNVLRR